MKHKFLLFLLAFIVGAAALTACASDDKGSSEAVNRVYPDGQGKYYDPSDMTQQTDSSAASKGTTAATKTTTKPAATTKPKTTAAAASTVPTAVNPAATSTQTTVQANVPADNISGGNINPNIGAIQSDMQNQIDSLAVTSIALSSNSLTVSVGETSALTVTFRPSNAVNKTCTAAADNQNVSVAVSGKTVSVTGVKAGVTTLTVTSANGHKATCNITVRPSQSSATDDTALSHGELVTAANADRWATAVSDALESLGMARNGSLQGNSIVLTTDGLDNKSFNTVLNEFISQAQSGAEQLTDSEWDSYEFNCVYRAQSNGEYAIVISINEL